MDLYDAYRLDIEGKPVMWESFNIFRKLSLVCVATFVIHPIGKLYVILVLLLIYLVIQMCVQPYDNRIVNVVEGCSIALLCLLASMNLFWAYIYMWNEMNIPYIDEIGAVFLFF